MALKSLKNDVAAPTSFVFRFDMFTVGDLSALLLVNVTNTQTHYMTHYDTYATTN